MPLFANPMTETALFVPPNFTCRRCGNCCRGPGDVLLLTGEDQRIAELVGLDLYAFTSTYTRLTEDRSALSLSERPDGACIFLQPDNTCRIQAVKPQQCRAFPYLWQSPRLANMCAGWQVDTNP
ncbi:MAG: YkgJ family cysteine cluster protein [Kiritimatiellia bacterium]